MKTPKPEHWKFLFGLWSLQGIAALFWLVVIPTDTDNPLAFGFSPARLILMGMAIVLVMISVLLWFGNRRLMFHQTGIDLDEHFVFWDSVYLTALSITAIAVGFVAVVPLFKSNSLYAIYAARLAPLVFWGGLSSLELAGLIAWNRITTARRIFIILAPVWKKVVFVLAFFFAFGVLVAVTKVGVTPDANWGDPPVPFFEWQLLLVLVLIGTCTFFSGVLPKVVHAWIPLGIYLFAVVLWLSQPIVTAYTATSPRAPNFEIYPFSDPQFYAQYAQSALVGNGFLWPEVPARPFYVAFLTWMHLLGNQHYQTVVVLQTFVLALFPVILYQLGKEIGGSPLGLGLALLAAFRDINSNATALFASNVTYSKLFLSELPAALLISLATLLSIRWLRSATRPVWLPLLVGALLGVAALIRLQSAVLIALLIFLALFVISDRKQWLKGSIFIVLGFAMLIVPWLTRNYFATGGLVLDNPISQTMTMARRWGGSSGNEMLPRLPGESDAQYSSRLTRMALDSFKRNPGFILHSAANHFVNNEITSLLAFPIRDEIQSPSELLTPQHAFWKTPIATNQLPLFMFYLLLFSIGIVAAWQYHGPVGMLPLGFGLAYNLWTALFLSSGVRFIVPLDWSVQLYEFLGLIVLGGLLLSFTKGARESVLDWFRSSLTNYTIIDQSPAVSRRSFFLSLLVVLFLAAFLPVTEFVFPQKYPPKSQSEIARQSGMTIEKGETALYGRAVYPRYYDANDGEPETAKLGYGPEENARLVFFLIGPKSELVIFELDNVPEFFPNTSDVYMIGTQKDGYFSPRVVKVIKDSRTELYRNK